MKTILVPTDFSPNATQALHYAAGLASAIRGKVILAHVINLPVNLPASPEAALDLAADPRLWEEAEVALAAQAREARLEEGFLFELSTCCQAGALLPTLNELIKAHQVDLVVMGTRGATTFLDRLLGSNTALFMKNAVCPVLAIPAGARYSGWRHLAYGAELEEEETSYLHQLFGLAQPFGAAVALVHVASGQRLNIGADHQFLREIRQHFGQQPYHLETRQEDDVAAALEGYAREKAPDLLALAIRDRDLLEDLFHKSLTRQLMAHPALPLLALPAKPYRNTYNPAARTPAGLTRNY
jgi:nucleotide-binding universal stress UspA family protein